MLFPSSPHSHSPPLSQTHTIPFLLSLAVSFCILETWLLKSVPWVLGQESTPGQYSQIYFVLISCSLQVLSWTWECLPAKDKDKLQRKHLYGFIVLLFKTFLVGSEWWLYGTIWGKLSRRSWTLTRSSSDSIEFQVQQTCSLLYQAERTKVVQSEWHAPDWCIVTTKRVFLEGSN